MAEQVCSRGRKYIQPRLVSSISEQCRTDQGDTPVTIWAEGVGEDSPEPTWATGTLSRLTKASPYPSLVYR
jgi:hypothetical protein